MYNDSIFTQNRDILYGIVADNIDFGIILGKNQTLDSVAAAVSLYLSLHSAGKNVQIISSDDLIVEHANLVGVDKIKKSFVGATKMLILSIPFKEGEVEKVSFNTEQDRMNFNITASESGITPFDEKDIRIIRRGSNPQILFTVGVSTLEEVQGVAEVHPETKIINIDSNPQNTLYGTVVLADSSFSSLSEIVVRMIQELALPCDVDIAQNLLDGVSFSTKNFSVQNTSFYAFEAGAFLLREGARRSNQEKKQMSIENRQPFASYQQPSSMQQPQVPSYQQPSFSQPQKTEEKHTQPMNSDTQSLPEDQVPSDWFVPKVFKGSKKTT